jgi:hypothetical protein
VSNEPTPTLTDETAPTLTEETAPAVTEETAPTLTEETAPAVTEETAPAATEETAPTLTEETAPTHTDETGPVNIADATAASVLIAATPGEDYVVSSAGVNEIFGGYRRAKSVQTGWINQGWEEVDLDMPPKQVFATIERYLNSIPLSTKKGPQAKLNFIDLTMPGKRTKDSRNNTTKMVNSSNVKYRNVKSSTPKPKEKPKPKPKEKSKAAKRKPQWSESTNNGESNAPDPVKSSAKKPKIEDKKAKVEDNKPKIEEQPKPQQTPLQRHASMEQHFEPNKEVMQHSKAIVGQVLKILELSLGVNTSNST